MRLINVKTMKLETFFEGSVPPYAILSHTWGEDEVTLQQMQQMQQMWSKTKGRLGWTKIELAAKQASQDDIEFVWVDTVCIDKTSSAELQEAINSMWNWYQNAETCYVFLSDAHVGFDGHCVFDFRSFRQSRWFTRGWTLQELIAPHKVEFFDASWNPMGSKTANVNLISEVTTIETSVLTNEIDIFGLSVAKRMSWAARRQTSRIEDRAYSLLGIFNVNMPMLYGEGPKAFVRLQEEIIKASTDDSIFAWSSSGDINSGALLAESPQNFIGAGNIVRWGFPSSFELTNRGLHAEMLLKESAMLSESDLADREYAALLNCRFEDDLSGTLAIRVQKSFGSEDYRPVAGRDYEFLAFDTGMKLVPNSRLAIVHTRHISRCRRMDVYISRNPEYKMPDVKFWVRLNQGGDFPCNATVIQVHPPHLWDAERKVVRSVIWTTLRAGIRYQCASGTQFAVVFGYDHRSHQRFKTKLHPVVWAHFYSNEELFGDFCDSHVPGTKTYRDHVDPILPTSGEAFALYERDKLTCDIVEADIETVFVINVSITRNCELEGAGTIVHKMTGLNMGSYPVI